MNGAIVHVSIPTPITLCYSTGNKRKSDGKGTANGKQARQHPYGHKGGVMVPFKGTGMGFSGIVDFRKDLQAEGVLPGGKWQNDDGALHIGSLPPDTTDKDLYEIFAPFGAIPSRGVRAMTNPDGTCTGVAFVNYITANS